MNAHIREYRPEDRDVLVRLMEELQQHIVDIDPLRRHVIKEGYGTRYVDGLLEKVGQQNGCIFVAEMKRCVVGCVVVGIDLQTDEDLLGMDPIRDARVLELVVISDARGSGIGSALMNTAEEYARAQQCDGIRVEVFTPNHGARRFYEKCGYEERVVDMLKKL